MKVDRLGGIVSQDLAVIIRYKKGDVDLFYTTENLFTFEEWSKLEQLLIPGSTEHTEVIMKMSETATEFWHFKAVWIITEKWFKNSFASKKAMGFFLGNFKSFDLADLLWLFGIVQNDKDKAEIWQEILGKISSLEECLDAATVGGYSRYGDIIPIITRYEKTAKGCVIVDALKLASDEPHNDSLSDQENPNLSFDFDRWRADYSLAKDLHATYPNLGFELFLDFAFSHLMMNVRTLEGVQFILEESEDSVGFRAEIIELFGKSENIRLLWEWLNFLAHKENLSDREVKLLNNGLKQLYKHICCSNPLKDISELACLYTLIVAVLRREIPEIRDWIRYPEKIMDDMVALAD